MWTYGPFTDLSEQVMSGAVKPTYVHPRCQVWGQLVHIHMGTPGACGVPWAGIDRAGDGQKKQDIQHDGIAEYRRKNLVWWS